MSASVLNWSADRRCLLRFHPGCVWQRTDLAHADWLGTAEPAGAGAAHVRNALAATAVTLAMGIDLDDVIRGLAGFAGVKGRLQRKLVWRGSTIIDDTYNANPDSVAAALNVLSAQPGKKWLVLGDMGELGDSAAQHYDIGNLARKRGVDHVFCMGENSQQAVAAFGAGAKHYALWMYCWRFAGADRQGCHGVGQGSVSCVWNVVQALTAEGGNNMLLLLAQWLGGEVRAFNVFNYLTLRTVLAMATSLCISLMLGPAG